MSHSAVFHSPIFWTYLAIVAALLVIAGVALVALRQTSGPVWATYRGWLIMLPVLVVAILCGRAGVIVLLVVLSLAAFREFAMVTALRDERCMRIVVYAAIVATGAIILLLPDRFGLFLSLPAFAAVAFALVPIVRNVAQGQLQAIALALFGFLTIGWMFLHLAWLARLETMGHLFYLLLAVELTDVAAFTFGKFLGKRPLRSAISPNKTWAGALGALAFAMLLPWIMRFSLPHFGVRELIFTGLIVGIGGPLGDLTVSVIKRDVGVKDMGRLIPGHGGVLDRVDSLLYTSPLFLHLVNHSLRFG